MSFGQTAKVAYATLTTTAREIETPLPTALVKGMEEIEKPARALGKAVEAGPHDLADAVVAAIDAGRDPADDDDVRRVLARRDLLAAGIAKKLEDRAEEHQTALLRKHAGAIVETWHRPTEEAGEALAHARATIPGVDLTDPRTSANLTPSNLKVWGEARLALAQLGKVMGAWTTLMVATKLANVRPEDRPLILADLTGREHLGALRSRGTAPALLVHQTGAPIALADAETFRARLEALADTKARAQADAEARAKAAMGRHGASQMVPR